MCIGYSLQQCFSFDMFLESIKENNLHVLVERGVFLIFLFYNVRDEKNRG